jgi:hypothetical protein
MGPPTSSTLIRPDQPLQRLGPYETPNITCAILIRPDQPSFQRQGPYETPNMCDPDQA